MATIDGQTVELNAATLTASLKLEKTSFNQVAFCNVSETYGIGNDVDLTYVIGPDMEISSRDWVGLYQVGWRSTDNYMWYEWSPMPSGRAPGRQSECRVVFPAAKLPKDDGEFYQFCYITSKGQVRGLSSPFQFRKQSSISSSIDDLIEIEDENGELLIIKTKTAYLEDQLKKANEKCSMLNQDITLLESEKEVIVLSKQDVERKLSNVAEENGGLKKQLTQVHEQLTQMSAQVATLKSNVSHLSEMNGIMAKSNEQLERTLVEKESCISEHERTKKTLYNEKDAILGQLKSLEEEKALYKIHFNSTESAIQSHVSRITELQSQLDTSQLAATAMDERFGKLQTQHAELAAQFEQLVTEGDKNMQTVKLLEERIAGAELEISERDKREIELKNELSAAVEKNMLLSSDVELSKVEVETLRSQLEEMNQTHTQERDELLRRLEQSFITENREKQEKEQLVAEVSNLRVKLEEVAGLAGADSALYALNAAHSVLKERYFKLEKKVAQQQVLLDQSAGRSRELEDEVTAGQREITQLKARLQMGLEQYKEKVVECLTLQNSTQKANKPAMRQHKGNPASEESSMLARLQVQMEEIVAELERRDERIREMALHLTNEGELRSSVERRASELEQELQTIKDVLAMAIVGPPPTEAEFTSLQTVSMNLPAILAVPALSTLAQNIYRQNPTDLVTVMHEPLVPMQAPMTPNKLYPELSMEQPNAGTEGTGSSDSLNNVQLHLDNAAASWSVLDAATIFDSLPSSPGDVLPVCPICQFQFPPGVSTSFRSAHIDMHFVGDMCPMCNAKFPLNCGEQYRLHVHGHFTGAR